MDRYQSELRASMEETDMWKLGPWTAGIGAALLIISVAAPSRGSNAIDNNRRLPEVAQASGRVASPLSQRSHANEDDPYGYTAVPGYRGGPDAASHYDAETRLVSGRITGTTGAFGRKLHVRLDTGEVRTVEGPRDVIVRRNSRPISIHELRRDEAVHIRLTRYLANGDLVAERIEAYDGASPLSRSEPDRPATVRGNVSSIDSALSVLRIDSGRRRIIIHTEHALVRNSEGSVGLRDLQNGDPVVVEGRRDGNDVFALTVTVQTSK